ncbi:Uncharacterised protein [Sphingobacterium daejeonense]|nr:Uncharacterised protein [Sphingobacterium daejeonense]
MEVCQSSVNEFGQASFVYKVHLDPIFYGMFYPLVGNLSLIIESNLIAQLKSIP